jgi:2-C-methyl-D-erythritol 4-phosphate cytidylyltransferase
MTRPATGSQKARPRDAAAVVAIVAAAGSGTRVGGAVPKQFLKVGGRTLLEHALRRLGSHPAVVALVAVVPRARLKDAAALARKHPKLVAVVAGGARRQDSVERGLAAISAGDGAIVLVHDAARPMVPRAVVSSVIEAARRHGAAVPGLPPSDTIKMVGRGGRVIRTLDRSGLRMVQTPQGFRISALRRAFRVARRRHLVATDDASLAEAAGVPVVVVPGDPANFKVTTRDDLGRLRGFGRRR